MINFRYMLPAVAMLAAIPAVSNAQSIPLCETTYHIQVEYEHWTSGSFYWATEFTTDDFEEAVIVLELFESALESGDLRHILGTGSGYLTVDVRLLPITKCRYLEYWQKLPVQRLPVQSWQTRSYQIRRP